MHWSLALHNRLECLALVLLSQEMEKRVDEGRKNATVLAERIGQLGGAITGDPAQFVDLFAVDDFVLLSSGADYLPILESALDYERLFIQEDAEFGRQNRDRGLISYEAVLGLLKYHIEVEDELETSLANQDSAARP